MSGKEEYHIISSPSNSFSVRFIDDDGTNMSWSSKEFTSV